MPASEARMIANRKNAALSSGPKTPEGKERSRANALKHGLTGSGVVLLDEDAAEVALRSEELVRELQPEGELGRSMVVRVAFLSVRLERSGRQEMAATAARVRHAEADFDDNRLDEVDALIARLAVEPGAACRRLRRSPEGVEWLLGRWAGLRDDLAAGDGGRWTDAHRVEAENLMGRRPGDFRVSRVAALSRALEGDFGHLGPADGAGLDGWGRAGWARRELAAIIDAEVARLVEAREAIDLGAIERDRAGAADRALFDPSHEATLARKYEAATERGLYRALRESRESREAEAPEATGSAPPVEEARAAQAAAVRALGSFFPGAVASPQPPKATTGPAVPAPRAPLAPRIPAVGGWSEVPMTIGRAGAGSV